MQRFILITTILVLIVSILNAESVEPVRNYGWNIYTNTSYLHQIEFEDENVISATWGGVNIFNKNSKEFDVINRSDGLLRNEVRSLHHIEALDQTWVGNLSYGISRYKEGVFLSPYQENQGIDAEIIYDIADNGDYIFIGSNQGLSMLLIDETANPSFKKTFTAPQWLSDNNVHSITFDDSNRVWLATDSGINYVEISYDNMILPENWKIFTFSQTSEKISDIEYQNGKIYYASADGFAIIDSIYKEELDAADVEYFPGYLLPSEQIANIEIQNDSTIWVAYGEWKEEFQEFADANGVGRFQYINGSWDEEHWHEPDSLYEQVSDIKVDTQGEVWFASWREGLYHFVDGEWDNYKPNCIGSNYITDMMFESKRNLWCSFGSKFPNSTPKGVKGVSRFDGEKWKNFRKEPYADEKQIWSDKVFTVEEDGSGNIWLGSWSEGLGILNPNTMECESYTVNNTDWLSGNNISLLEFHNDQMWIGCYGWSPGGVTVYTSESDYHEFVPDELVEGNQADMWAILLYKNYVWLGGYLSGIQYWKGEELPVNYPTPTGNWYVFEGSEASNCQNFGVQENYGYIFGCCDNGLYMYDEYYDSWYKYTSGMELNVKAYKWINGEWSEHYYYYDGTENSEPRLGFGRTNSVNDIYIDQHNRKWLATEYGISMLGADNYIFRNFTTENSDLPDNKVKSLAYDPYTGLLYAGTQEGLCSFKIGATEKDTTFDSPVSDVKVFPNPYKPKVHDYLYFQPESGEPLPEGKNSLRIYNMAGELVVELPESDNYRFYWDCQKVASGIYFYVLSSEYNDKQIKGKFGIIR